MGVPAFFRWLSVKYPRVLGDVLEETSNFQGGTYLPVNADEPNPNGIEFDNLFLDMNGSVGSSFRPSARALTVSAPAVAPQHRPQLLPRRGPRRAARVRERDV